MIRPATAADCEAVTAIAHSAFELYLGRMDKKPAPMTENYAELISQNRVFVLEALAEGANAGAAPAIAGFLVLLPEEAAMLLDTVAVAPEAQGKGYGKKLLLFAESEARAASYGSIRLYTNEVMSENLGLYAHLGYVETHRASEGGFNRVFMVKEL